MPLSADDGPDEYGDAVLPEPAAPESESAPSAPLSEYQPYDPTDRPTAPVLDLQDEEGNPLPGFDEKYRMDFEGLAFIGALSKSFSWMGHEFRIRTLTVDEMLAVAMLTKEYEGSIGQGLAYRTVMAALAVVAVDGTDLPLPVGPEEDPLTWAHQRFNYAKARWFQFTIDAIYAEYLELEEKTHAVVTAMGKALSPTGSMGG